MASSKMSLPTKQPVRFQITEMGKPKQFAGVTMTIGINEVYANLNAWRPFKDNDLDTFIPVYDSSLVKHYDEAVQAGLFTRWEGAPTRFQFTPLGKKVWGSFLLYLASKE